MASKQDLTETLVARGMARGALARMTKEALEALVAEEPRRQTVKAETLTVGLIVVGTRVRNPIRKAGRVVAGRKFVTVWDTEGRDYGYWPIGTDVEIVVL